MEIIPTPLSTSASAFTSHLEQLSGYFQHFQIDVADGQFVPDITLDIDTLAPLIKKNRQQCQYDFHLMVNDYQSAVQKINDQLPSTAIKTILIHFSRSPDINALNRTYPYVSFGIVLNPEDSVASLMDQYDIADLKHLQIMSVHPGHQGASFIPTTLEKIPQLRSCNFNNTIYLDGGINEQTLPAIMKERQKPDVLCIGSYLSEAENINERIAFLQSLKNA